MKFLFTSRFLQSQFFFLLFLVSCTSNESYLPGYSGNMGEIILIMDNKHWNSTSGGVISNYLEQAQFGLPQDEPVFKIVHVAPRDFAKIFQTHRNILIIDFKDNLREVQSEVKMNSWAKGQMVMKITAPSDSSLIDFMNKYSEIIINKFNQIEIDRQIEKNKIHGQTINADSLNPFSILLQKDSYVARQSGDFLWIRSERGRNLGGYEHQISQGVFIYWQNYSDTLLFSPENIISRNDSVTKKYIAGAVAGSYMATSFKLIPPQAKKIKFHDKFAVEIRGLWRIEKDFMGGPFISLTFLDAKNNRILTAVGYVFSPQFDKLLYLREVEAMVKSIEIKS